MFRSAATTRDAKRRLLTRQSHESVKVKEMSLPLPSSGQCALHFALLVQQHCEDSPSSARGARRLALLELVRGQPYSDAENDRQDAFACLFRQTVKQIRTRRTSFAEGSPLRALPPLLAPRVFARPNGPTAPRRNEWEGSSPQAKSFTFGLKWFAPGLKASRKPRTSRSPSSGPR